MYYGLRKKNECEGWISGEEQEKKKGAKLATKYFSPINKLKFSHNYFSFLFLNLISIDFSILT